MSLTDTLGSLAVATKGQFMTGVSVDIGTSFVKPGGRVGDELTAKAVVTGIGQSRRSGYACDITLANRMSHRCARRQVPRVHPRRFLQRPGTACSIWP